MGCQALAAAVAHEHRLAASLDPTAAAAEQTLRAVAEHRLDPYAAGDALLDLLGVPPAGSERGPV